LLLHMLHVVTICSVMMHICTQLSLNKPPYIIITLLFVHAVVILQWSFFISNLWIISQKIMHLWSLYC